MSQSALSNIEREKRSARPATIHRIARALRVPVAAITREYDDTADHRHDTTPVSDLTLRRRPPDPAGGSGPSGYGVSPGDAVSPLASTACQQHDAAGVGNRRPSCQQPGITYARMSAWEPGGERQR